jgi:hypothetical protein
MREKIIFTLILAFSLIIPIEAAIINIPEDYATIQAGIDASADGDTVLVAEGHYYERINFHGKGILVVSEFILDGDTTHVQNTTIDADTLVLGVADTGSVVCFVSGEDSAAVIQGFTLQNGIGTFDDYDYKGGGGIVCLRNSSPTISNNIVTGNYAYNGGGIYCMTSSPIIENNLIIGNSAVDAGGIGCYFSSFPIISENIITENSAEYVGGGICSYQFSLPIISNNTISENSAEWGSGVLVRYSSGLINNNRILGNSANLEAGGIACRDYSSPNISENIISDNSARYGAGIHISYNSSPNINGNTIIENIAGWGGGAIFCSHNASPIICDNTISGNISTYYGGGLECHESSPILCRNTISENSTNLGGVIYCANSNPAILMNLLSRNTAENGGGIFCLTSVPIISNNTMIENIVHSYGGAIYWYNSTSEIINTIFWANVADSGGTEIYLNETSSIAITFSDIQGGWDGEGNIDSDPLFRYPENGDFHLMAIDCDDPHDSPCIDMGTPGIIDSLLDCDWGLGMQRSDMGAYGGGQGQVVIDEPENELPKQISLFQNYPNPFNASTTIKYELPRQSRVTIEIYDILGRKISLLIDKQMPASYHQVIWNAGDIPSGVYFYKLQADDFSETKKMLLLK